MRLSTITSGVGSLFIIWFFGGFDFAPKLLADLSKWEGADSINKFGSSALKFISNQWQNKIGDVKPLAAETSQKLGSEICLPNTTNPDAKLSKADYDKHVSQVNLRTKSILQSPNSSVFCYDKSNHSGFVYRPEWLSDKFLIIDAITGGEKVLDFSNESTK